MSLFEAEQALSTGQEFSGELDPCETEILAFRRAQLANDAAAAQHHLAQALEISRSSDSRNHLLEARIRMEWGLLRSSLGEEEQAGVDLKWAMERLGALDEGHPWHGLAILNLAAWHRNRGEFGMALAVHAELSRHGPHAVETIALSRRRAAELLIAKDHMMSAVRNLWIAHHGFRQTGLEEAAIEAGLHWLDLGLSDVSQDALTMDEVVEDATPRSIGESLPALQVHPTDVRIMVDWLSGRTEDPDAILVLTDAAQALQSCEEN